MSAELAKGSASAPVQGAQDAAKPEDTALPVAPEPKKDEFAEKLELLSRKERGLWRERQKIQAETKKIAEYEAKIKAFEEAKAKASQNPLDYLSQAGLSYDKLTEFMLNGGKPTAQDELAALRDEFKRLREEQTNKEKQQQEQQTKAQSQAQEQAISSFKDEITEFVESNKEQYELASMRDATEDIFTTINDAFTLSLNEWNRTGRRGQQPKPMSIKEAADLVEEFYEKEVIRLTETNKLKSRFQPAQQQEQKQPSKTLTNNMASTAASVVPAKTDHDRMRRALEKLGGS